jgi:hypothetical protein
MSASTAHLGHEGLTCIKGSFPGCMNDGMPGQLPKYMPLPLYPGNYAGGSRIEETWGGDVE